MQHENPVAAYELPDHTQAAREGLTRIVAGIDARFMKVGTMLAGAVEAIDVIASALREVSEVFENGAAAVAVTDLAATAKKLSEVPELVAQRASEVALIRAASARLSSDVRESGKFLEVLQIYGMNVKIAASGAVAFVEFADRMTEQLQSGKVEIRGFDVQLSDLHTSLAHMERNDSLLLEECRKIIPQVPDRLIEDSEALRAHQGKLGELATSTSALARSIQTDVGAILGALQIGDIARQRLEHVLAACVLLEGVLAGSGMGPDEQAATQAHILHMLIAQSVAISTEFQRETTSLVASLRRLQPEAARLVALQRREGGNDGQMFLRGLEAGISDAATMVARLHQADEQADETLRLIVDTVDNLSGRTASIRRLRIDVQQMAINIGLRCRRVDKIGRPVTVIANEIRSYSDRLDATTNDITAAAAELNTVSLRMREQAQGRQTGADGLSGSIDIIRQSAQRSEDAMAAAGVEADGISDMLRRITGELEDTLRLGCEIEAVVEILTQCIGPATPIVDRPDHPVRMLLTEIARSYTMVSERLVHDQFLLPDMMATAGTGGAVPTGGGAANEDDASDDDALFDDTLF